MGAGSAAMDETDLSGSVQYEYIFFGGARIARRVGTGNTVHYYFADHLGSTSTITDSAGSLQNQSMFYPFGGEIPTTGPNVANTYRFTGKERDAESNLDDFGARYYAFSTGRFMSPDWAARPTAVPYAAFGDPQSLNLYGYVRNDPVSRADEDGHDYNVPYNVGSRAQELAGCEMNPHCRIEVMLALNLSAKDALDVSVCGHVGCIEQSVQQRSPDLLRNVAVSTERFRTRDAAAMAAEKIALAKTKETNKGKTDWEYGGWIVRDKKGLFAYTIPAIGTVRGKVDIQNMIVSDGFTEVAGYHTHPDESGFNEGFSTGPLSDTGWADANRTGLYVADVSSRNLYRYDPGRTQVKSYDKVTGDLVGRVPE
jgi:RHS repeat-associated protein